MFFLNTSNIAQRQ